MMIRMLPSARVARTALAPCAALALLSVSTAAVAADVGLKVEPDVAFPLSAPQTERFGVGGGQSVKVLFGLTPWLDVGPAVSFHFLPASSPYVESGTIWGFGGGLRLKRPHDADSLHGLSPWLDADALYIRTGDFSRPGFDAAVGISAPVGEARALWVGPFVRYLHVGQPALDGYDEHDAKTLSLGLTLEVGSSRARDAKPAPVADSPPCPACDDVACPDGDQDGVPDSVDRCPEVVGTLDDYGCPAYKKVIVREDKLELKERLYFAWDAATLEPESHPVLDEVVQALKDNRNFRVQVEGHTDSTGGDDHNQTLSEARAAAVLDYLTSHGVAKDRLVSKGFSSSVPADTNETAAGRENNRRVEFVVSFILLNGESAR